MDYVRFDNENYYTLKEVYKNLCVTRTSIVNKLEQLEKDGYVLRVKNKRPEIYISQKGYDKLKTERIKYLSEQINDKRNVNMKEHYLKLKEAIENPELWDKYHKHEISDTFYFKDGKVIAIESKGDGKKKS